MEITIINNQEFIILSPNVTNATKCFVTNVLDGKNFNVELVSEENFSPEESVDLFSVAGSGVLYFQTKLSDAQGKLLTVEFPQKTTLIQRREYTRVEINKNILIYTDEKTIRATIIDISAGGMCIISDTDMDKNSSYHIDVNLEKNLSVSCKFKPIRIIPLDDNKYKISGQFKLIKNVDRVALSQYCLKKNAEIQHK